MTRDGAASDPPEEFTDLAGELGAVLSKGAATPMDDAAFDALARRVATYQFEHCGAYGTYCAARGVRPATMERWGDIPAVPTAAFKVLDLTSAAPGTSSAIFRTSGTTGGDTARGVHHVPDLDLYHGSLLPNFRAHLLPEGGRMPVLSLVPDASELPDSSLSHMIELIVRDCGSEGTGYFVSAAGALDIEGFLAAAEKAVRAATPVLVVGTAFAFVHLIDSLKRSSTRVALPEGSRAMETGGFKGRSREMPRSELYEAIRRTLGIHDRWIVNEYGMTELLSQFYDGVAGAATAVQAGATTRLHRPPPWMRTRVVDPVSLEPVTDGCPGLLAHFDLANLGSVSAVLTEDLGIGEHGGFHLLGRAAGAEPRGCSIAMDDLLAAIRR